MDTLESGYRRHGVVDIIKDEIAYRRWWTSDDRRDGAWTLQIDGTPVRVASYLPYSGTTDEAGVTAPLLLYDRANPPDSIAGHMVVFTVPPFAESPFGRAPPAGYAFATEPHVPSRLATEQFYQSNYFTRLGRLDQIARDGKAAGIVLVVDLSPGRADGLYTIPVPREPIGAPGLMVDRVAGAEVIAAARVGRSATITLRANEAPAQAYTFAGFLPGADYGTDDDEIVLMITHSDGFNLTQDNGGFGMLGLVQYFSRSPQQRRPRTLLLLLDPEHFTPDRHSTDWFALHPEIASRIVASIGVEHLGQRDYVETGDAFELSGAPEWTTLYAQDNDRLIDWAVAAVTEHKLPRTMIQVPARANQGRWVGMGEVAVYRRIPGYGITADMSAYWSTAPGIESFDAAHFRTQLKVLAQLTGHLMTAPRGEMAVGDTP